MERESLVDLARLQSNVSTERFQPHHGWANDPGPVDPHGAVGVLTTIERGPTGVGAVYRWAEPSVVSGGYHNVRSGMPLVARPTGA